MCNSVLIAALYIIWHVKNIPMLVPAWQALERAAWHCDGLPSNKSPRKPGTSAPSLRPTRLVFFSDGGEVIKRHTYSRLSMIPAKKNALDGQVLNGRMRFHFKCG